MKKEVMSFRQDVPAGETVIIKERIKDNGTIEQVRVRFYAGQEKELQVRPYVEHHARNSEDVISYAEGTQPFLSGEDDEFIFPCAVDVQYDDSFVVWAKNNDLVYTYTVSVDVVISYFGSEVI
jgi:hypothetical protein